MGNRRTLGIALTATVVAVSIASRASAAVENFADGGVLDRLTVPAVPGADRIDEHAKGQPQPTDVVAVPSPSAAGSGLVLLSGLMLWKASRRVTGRA